MMDGHRLQESGGDASPTDEKRRLVPDVAPGLPVVVSEHLAPG